METNVSLRLCRNPRKALLATAAFLLGGSLAAGPLQPNELSTTKQNHRNNPVACLRADKKENVIVSLTVLKHTLNGKVTSNNAGAFQFFLFRTDGTLEKQCNISSGEKFAVPGIVSGTYIYQVMQNDRHIKTGTVIIKT